MECEIPELVVFLQEDDCQVYKDICIDAEARCQRVSPVEKCELDCCNISHILKYEVDMDRVEAAERVIFVSPTAESSPETDRLMDRIKHCKESGNLKEDNVDRFVTDDNVKSDSLEKDSTARPWEKQIQEPSTETIAMVTASSNGASKDRDIVPTSNLDARRIAADLSSPNTITVPDAIVANTDPEQLCNNRDIPEVQEEVPASSVAAQRTPSTISLLDHNVSTSSMKSHSSDHFSFPEQLQRPDSISFRSTSSATSARSFAFPTLSAEWSGSPVRMARAENAQLKKHKRWKSCFCC